MAQFLIDKRSHDERGDGAQVEFGRPVVRSYIVTSRYGVIRGMHFQDFRTAPLTKIVNVIHGEVHAFALDLHTRAVERFVLVPHSGFLHVPPWEAFGYAVVSPSATVQYLFDGPQDVEAERFINPLSLGVIWPRFHKPILCQRDREAPGVASVLRSMLI